MLLLVFLIPSSLKAQTANGRFLSWDFSTVTATNITTWPVYFGNSTYIDTAGDFITQGPGLNPGATAIAGAMTFQGINGNLEADAISNGDYVEFQITPKSGFEVRLDSFIYRWQYQNAGATINTSIRTSLDNYATTVGSVAGVANATAFGNT
ncbi:MAG: hypothetical protein FGM54_11930, partial [Chitinophagaceae bacterium]|nr:hypothetical protein [Chitinophagaceae bacterium]